jgi:hypothetical protein
MESFMSEDYKALRLEIEKLRRCVDFLHAYSLKLREQEEILIKQRDRLVVACESVVSSIRDNSRARHRPTYLLRHVEDALAEVRRDRRSRVPSHVSRTLSAENRHVGSEAHMVSRW